VSRGALDVPDGVVVVSEFDTALVRFSELGGVESTFVIGGGMLYADALVHPSLRYVYLTRIEGDFDCDTRIPDLDALGFVPVPWDGAQTAEDNGVRYSIQRLTSTP
jgi:dihydrofolate reductase